FKLIKRQTLYEVNGVPMIRRFFEYTEKIRNFEAKPDDVLVATYPKANTTWMIKIVDCILSGGITDKIRNQSTHSHPDETSDTTIKDNEAWPMDILDATLSPRLVKTHLLVKLVPPSFWENNCRIIYIARNAKEVLVLYVFYEDIVQDPQRVIERVSHFLGRTFRRTAIDEIVKHTALSNMKDNPMTNFSNLPWFNLKVSPFMRKGKVGDWKNHFTFTVAQNERFEKEYRRHMAKTSLHFTDDL
uniref:Sulfotransferase n=1 Tax=Erpetoichthys calabaricus TaxID=27687 RepID=A0A8C4SVZ5_ERPCA